MDIIDAYHHGTLHQSQVSTSTYVVPLAPEDDGVIIFINLVVPMECVDSTKFFCAISKTLTDVVNALINTTLTVPEYGAIARIPAT